MTDDNDKYGMLDWCDHCDWFLEKCGGTNHPAFCPKIVEDECDEND